MPRKKLKHAEWKPPPKPKLPRSWGRKRDHSKWFLTPSDHAAWAAGYRFYFPLVEHFLDFCRDRLTFVRGTLTGQPVEFLDFQIDEIIAPILGWVHRSSGYRRIRRAYVELTKKQGKTTLAACLMLYGLLCDWEGGARVISNGPTQMQAGLAWDIAVDMLEQSELNECVGFVRKDRELRAGNIHLGKVETSAAWKALAHSSGARGSAQGIDASMILNDELHEWPSWDHWRQVTKAGIARKNHLMLSITNAGLSKEGPCWAEHEYARRVLSGELIDVSFHGYMRETDEQAAEDEIDAVAAGSEDISVARAANPAIGQIVDESEVVRSIREAAATPGERGNTLRLTYSVWRTWGDAPWLGHLWGGCRSEFTEEDCMGLPCWAGLDVAAVNDFTAAAFLFEVEPLKRYRTLVYFWLSLERLRELSRLVPGIDDWMSAGWIRVNQGRTTDAGRVRDDLAALIEKYGWQVGTARRVPQLIYDPRMAEVITADVSNATGCDRIEFSQTSQNYHHPCELLESWVGDGRIEHNGNPVLAFHATNVRCHQNTAEHKRPVRPGQTTDEKTIDGMVALIMAASQSDKPLPRMRDYYETNPVEVIRVNR